MSGLGNIFGSSKPKQTPAIEPPKVNVEPAPTTEKDRLARTGRASLISTGSLGLLGNATTGKKQLSV